MRKKEEEKARREAILQQFRLKKEQENNDDVSILFLMRLHHLVGVSTGPGYSLMRFDLQEKNVPG